MTFQAQPAVFEPDSLVTIGLTPREREVLAWVAEGKSNNAVGIILGISAFTVKKASGAHFSKAGRRDAHSRRPIRAKSEPSNRESDCLSCLSYTIYLIIS